MKKNICIGIFYFLFAVINAQQISAPSNSSNPQEFPVSFYVNSREQFAQIFKIAAYIEDYNPQNGAVKAYVNSKGYDNLLFLGYNPVQLVDTSAINAQYAIAHPEEVMYHDYSEFTTWVHNLAANYPLIVRLDSVGPTVESRWIWVLRISDNPDDDEFEPEFVYISTMHGDEPVGTELLIWFCDSLCQRYGSDTRLTRIVDFVDLWIIPLMNPDGNADGSRYNADGVDLNRNFPVPDGVDGDDGTYIHAPETQALLEFLSQRRQSFTINFHTGALLTNYPWDFDTIRSPDDELYIERSLNYTRSNIPMYHSAAFDSGITNGFDWYEVDGSMQDWDYHTGGGLHITIELNNVKWPDDSYLPGLWDDNYEAMVSIIEHALTGIHGIVVDSLTGEPLDADIWFDQIGRWVQTDMPGGDFHRQISAGTYSLTVMADGYYPKRVEGITMVCDTSNVFLYVELALVDTIYFNDLETGLDGISMESFEHSQDWEWGAPTLEEEYPDYVPSGSNLIVTRLSGDYNDTSQSRLILPVDLTEVSSAALVYDEWYRFQSVRRDQPDTVAHDGGNIKIATLSDTTRVSPPWGYRMVCSEWNSLIAENDSLFADNEPGTPWHKTYISLDDYCGQNISILWDFGASLVNTAPGWYIDNIAVFAPNGTVGIAENEKLPVSPSIRIYPNPFNSGVRCQVSGVREQEIEIVIFDLRGNVVAVSGGQLAVSGDNRQPPTANREFIWQPDESITSGIYLVRARTKDGGSVTKRIVYLR